MGMTGLETALSVVQHTMVDSGLIGWDTLAERMSAAPARIGRLAGHGRPLDVGSPANLVLVDPATRWTVDPAAMATAGRNSPFRGHGAARSGRRDLPARAGHRPRRAAGGRVKALAVIVLVAALLLLWRMMFMGYRGKALRQKRDLPRPIGSRDWKGLSRSLEGVYVSTTDAENALDRIAAHGLGSRSAVQVGFVEEGIGFLRQGARSFVVPLADVVGVGHGPGMVGKWIGKEKGLVVLRWKLGDRVVDTGVRPRHPAEGAAFAEQVEELVRNRKNTKPGGAQ